MAGSPAPFLIDAASMAALLRLIDRVAPGTPPERFFPVVSEAFTRAQAEIAPENMLFLLRRNTTHRVFRQALEHVHAACKPACSILVLGCGAGYAGLNGEYAETEVRSIFTEMSGYQVTRADLIPDDLLRPGGTGNFDVVVSHSVAHFVPNLHDYFRYIRTSLKAEGYFVLGREPNARFWRNFECREAIEKMRRAERVLKMLKRFLSPRAYLARLRRPVRSLKSTPIHAAVNQILQEEQGFRAALTPLEIAQVVDPHIPADFEGDFATGLDGLDWSLIGEQYLKEFELTWTGSSEHLGRRDPINRWWAKRKQELVAAYPNDGCFFTAVWRRP